MFRGRTSYREVFAIVTVAALALQPLTVLASNCACRAAAATPQTVEDDPTPEPNRSCCAAKQVAAAVSKPEPVASGDTVCGRTGRMHSSTDCCCVDNAPRPATTDNTAVPDLSPKSNTSKSLVSVLPTASAGPQVGALLRFGSPVELAHASRPSFSILYGVWRN